MGVPQGSVLSPMLFNIFMYDLPSVVSKNTDLTQFADDLSMIQKVTLKRSTSLKSIQSIQQNYQNELNKISTYMADNGLTLSTEKTKLILFNNGPDSKHLPKFTLNNSTLTYSQHTTFLGVTFTSKLNWSKHINNILNKGKSSLNFLKVVASHKWGQNTTTLRTLAISTVRSQFTYAQEIFFSAPDFQLKKLQSIDCKSFKIALGVPFHTNNFNTYNEINITPLNFYRKIQTTKFVIKSLAQKSSCSNEITITSENTYPKRGKNIKSLQPIRSYANSLLTKFDFNKENISPIITNTSIPPWLRKKPQFIIDYQNIHKSLNPSLIKNLVLEFIHTNFPTHLQIFTDGSKLESNQTGAAFFIPSLKISNSYYLGKCFSIFTAELSGILEALKFINTHQINNKKILFCTDSKAALLSIQRDINKYRSETIFEIQSIIHSLLENNFSISFLWLPSHCDIIGNETADKLAKTGASNDPNSSTLSIKYDLHEYLTILNSITKEDITLIHQQTNNNYSKICVINKSSINPTLLWKTANKLKSFPLTSLISKIRLNSLKTKFIQNITCQCSSPLSLDHLLFNCPIIKQSTALNSATSNINSLEDILNSTKLLNLMAKTLLSSPIRNQL